MLIGFVRFLRDRKWSVVALLSCIGLAVISFPNLGNDGSKADGELSGAEKAKPSKRSRPAETESASQAMERVRSKALEQLEARKNGPHPQAFGLLMKKGELTEGAARQANLTDEERVRVAGALKQMWEDASHQFRERLRYDAAESDPDNQRWTYRIPASKDRGASLRETLDRSLSEAVGKDRKDILLSELESGDPLGGFGRLDVRLEFSGNSSRWKCEYFNPDNGEIASYGEVDGENGAATFGDELYGWMMGQGDKK